MVAVGEVVYDILVSNGSRQDRSPPASPPALPLPPPSPHGRDADIEPVMFATGSAPHALYEASDAAYHLRELGFHIAIDDLGGGHARMGTFTPLDTDFVKLDMSLVRDVDKHQLKQRLIRSVTQLCREQGTQVIGEGVETEAEAQVLFDL